MKTIILALLITTNLLAQNSDRGLEGPIYDRDGQMIAYEYADGTRESYAYDSEGRMKTFTDRAGNVTLFLYGSDGSITTVMPDGSTQTKPNTK